LPLCAKPWPCAVRQQGWSITPIVNGLGSVPGRP